MATKKPMKKPVKRVRRFQEGGEASDKAAGLAASNMDPRMSFFERLRMGNIDQEGSQAYNRLGAGRGRGERAALSELAGMSASNNAMPVKNAEDGPAQNVRIADAQGAREMDQEMYQRAVREGERDEKRMAPSLAQTQIAAVLAAKPNVKPAAKSSAMTSKPATGSGGGRGAAAGEEDAYRASRAAAPATAPAAAAKPTAASGATTKEERQARIDQAFQPPSAENTQKGLEAATLGAGLGLKTIAGFAKNLANRTSKLKDRLRLDRPGTVSGEGFVMRDGKMVKDIAIKAPQKALPSTITDVVAKKRGGSVKKMAHGGSVKSSTASSRGDGIALRGKTRGKMY